MADRIFTGIASIGGFILFLALVGSCVDGGIRTSLAARCEAIKHSGAAMTQAECLAPTDLVPMPVAK